jgi:non-heme chloroperoxidase
VEAPATTRIRRLPTRLGCPCGVRGDGRRPRVRGGAVGYGFANAVSEEEAQELFDAFAVPGSGVPIFQAATANLNPWTEAKVDTKNPARGPLLIVSGGRDHTVPTVLAKAAYKKQSRNEGVTEFVEFAERGHALTIDSGWQGVADAALA